MKHLMMLFTALLLSFFPMNATSPVFDGDEGNPDLIDLYGQGNNENPNSLNSVLVTAYKTSSQIIIFISNYTGNVVAAAIGIGGHVMSDQNPVSGSGIVILDISDLPGGNYTIFITAGQLYQGSFSK